QHLNQHQDQYRTNEQKIARPAFGEEPRYWYCNHKQRKFLLERFFVASQPAESADGIVPGVDKSFHSGAARSFCAGCRLSCLEKIGNGYSPAVGMPSVDFPNFGRASSKS